MKTIKIEEVFLSERQTLDEFRTDRYFRNKRVSVFSEVIPVFIMTITNEFTNASSNKKSKSTKEVYDHLPI